MKIDIEERLLHFKEPAGTSRGVYNERLSWFVHVSDGNGVGVGECAPLPKLSCDDMEPAAYRMKLRLFCDEVERTGTIDYNAMRRYPSMLFGLETALLHLRNGKRLFDTAFSRGEVGIPMNGLVWMGTHDEMLGRLEQKLAQGFHCIKIKIGAIGFDDELDLIRHIRDRYTSEQVEIRVDANGGFSADEAFDRLVSLSQLDLHSIEQPIRAGQWSDMARLCRDTPLPIALDEELIGVNDTEQKAQLLDIVKPHYIILKPSLHGGMQGCREWIELASERGIKSWMTSALESNVGLDAIAQLCSDVYGDSIGMPQGLGTGQLFTDNIPMPLEVRGECLWMSE